MGSAVTSASTTQSLTLPAPAKLNLFLHVTGRRADGYHLLESVFVPINLADTIRLTRRSNGVVRLVDPPPGLDEQNELCCRAARALQAATGCALGVDIQVSKRIPQGAGLGGGSSDAATTLLGLNQLWGLGQSREALQQVAASLGADVPFFVFGRPALARGVGERLLAVTMPVTDYVLAFPGAGVATANVFTDPQLKRDTPANAGAVFMLDHGHNDLQPVAERLEPRIGALLADLAHLCPPGIAPRMTGSGACVFARAHNHEAASEIARQLEQSGWQSWAVRTIARHPLFAMALSATDSAII